MDAKILLWISVPQKVGNSRQILLPAQKVPSSIFTPTR